jgi:hypothetical protein
MNEFHFPRAANILMPVVWITAGVAIVLPFALGNSNGKNKYGVISG